VRECGEEQTDTQVGVTNIHFASAMPHAKCNQIREQLANLDHQKDDVKFGTVGRYWHLCFLVLVDCLVYVFCDDVDDATEV